MRLQIDIAKISMHVKRFFQSNKYLLTGLLVLALVILANVFPRGYVFCGGDTVQFIEAKNNLRMLFYAWEGRAFFYYGIFYVLDFLKISDTSQLSWYLGIFVVGSYLSFQFFSRLLFGAGDRTRSLVSLFYALNLYTLFLFSGNLSFSYYPTLYIFVPILIGLYVKFLLTRSNPYGAWFVLATLLASSGFGNVAFLYSFLIILLLITIFLWLAKMVTLDFRLLSKLFFFGVVFFFLNAFWLWPVIPEMKGGIESLRNDNALEFSYIIRHTSSPIMNTISFLNYSGDYFPNNFIYKKLADIKMIFFVLAFLPIFFILWGIGNLRRIDGRNRKIFLAFSAVLVVQIMLVARVVPPFEITNRYIYSLWGMEVLRGFDKTAVYLPFLFSILILIIFSHNRTKKWIPVLMVVIILTPLPFFTGKIQQNMSYRFSGASPENKDFRKSKLSFLVKIPDQYYQIRKTINNDKEKFFIATLPYTSNDGSNISNYPKWKMYGVDITQFLYDKNILVANKAYFPDWNYSRSFGDTDSENQWIAKLLGIMNVKYIIYHKDAPDDSVLASQEKIKNLEHEGLLTSLEDNEYFTLYQIKDDLRLPYISWQDKNVEISSDLYRIESRLDDIRNGYHPADFRELNPKKFLVNGKNMGKELVLSEEYDENWKAYAISNGQERELTEHFLASGYANGWKIPSGEMVDSVLVEYYPARLLGYGIVSSFLTALFLLIYLIIYYYGNNKHDKKNHA